MLGLKVRVTTLDFSGDLSIIGKAVPELQITLALHDFYAHFRIPVRIYDVV